jgi:hypothetical protein
MKKPGCFRLPERDFVDFYSSGIESKFNETAKAFQVES